MGRQVGLGQQLCCLCTYLGLGKWGDNLHQNGNKEITIRTT
jgi:hypothetical protein